MAGNGPAPKQQHQRERDTRRRQADSVTVTADRRVRGPKLVGDYLPQTVAWYDVWRRSPQAKLFEATDWQRLALLAPIVDQYWAKPHPVTLSEIRLNEERLGATYVDRLKARIRVEKEVEKPDATVTPLRAVRDDVRARLRSAPTAATPTIDDESADPAPF